MDPAAIKVPLIKSSSCYLAHQFAHLFHGSLFSGALSRIKSSTVSWLEYRFVSTPFGHPQSTRGCNWTTVSPVGRLTSIPDRIPANNARFQNGHADHDPGEIVVICATSFKSCGRITRWHWDVQRCSCDDHDSGGGVVICTSLAAATEDSRGPPAARHRRVLGLAGEHKCGGNPRARQQTVVVDSSVASMIATD